MLYYKHLDCVFIRIPKTASTVIVETILGSHSGNEIESEKYRGEWLDKFSFAFVRNPFDRFVSAFSALKQWKNIPRCDVAAQAALTMPGLLEIAADDSIGIGQRTWESHARLHVLPMTHPVLHLDKAKFVGRFETLSADLKTVAGKLGFRISYLHQMNESQHEHYSTRYDDKLRAAVAEFYRADLERFGYKFDAV